MAIFISYSHKDKEFVDSLAANLVKHRVRVWVDTWELNVGDSIIAKVQAAIQEADALLIVLSQASVRSEWCKKELSSGLIRELEEKRVIVMPVVLDDCEIPLFLRDKLHADFRVDKDKGLRQVLEAIAKVTSDTLGRVEQPKSYVDFGMYSILISGLLRIRLTLLEQAINDRYSVITEIIVDGNQPATKRYFAFADSGLEWFAKQVILEMIGDIVTKGNSGQLLLESSFPKTQQIIVKDDRLGISYQVNVESRRLGEDNGKDVLVDWGNQLNDLISMMRKEALRMPPEAKSQIARIMKNLE